MFEVAAATITRMGALLLGYKATLFDPQSRKRYKEKLALFGGKDQYEIPPEEWKDDMVIHSFQYQTLDYVLLLIIPSRVHHQMD